MTTNYQLHGRLWVEGPDGGGAVLTEAGSRAIDSFWSAYDDFSAFLAARSRQLDL